MSQLGGPYWIGAIISRASEIPEQSRAFLYISLPNEPQTWHAADADAAAVADQFWQSVNALTVPPEHAIDFAAELLERHRPWSAVDLLAHHGHRQGSNIPPALIERALRAAAEPEDPEPLPPGRSTTASAYYSTGSKPRAVQRTCLSNSSTSISRLFNTPAGRKNFSMP
jgi:hypothetical protein